MQVWDVGEVSEQLDLNKGGHQGLPPFGFPAV